MYNVLNAEDTFSLIAFFARTMPREVMYNLFKEATVRAFTRVYRRR